MQLKFLLLFVILIFTTLFASEENKAEKENTKQIVQNKNLSKKELTYKKYIKQRDQENEETEDDRFCSCDID